MSEPTQLRPQPSSDKSKFIRTYAKDVAALAGGQGRAPATVSAPPPPPVREVAPPKPSPPPVRPPQPQPSAAEREATLERLRQKVEASRPLPPPPVVAPPPVLKTPPPPITPPKVEEKLSPIHTYKSDFADRIDQKGASTFSVLAAEQDNQPKVVVVKKNSNVAAISIAVALIVFGGGGLGTAVWYVMHSNVLPGSPLRAPSLVFADEQVQLTSSGPELMSELAALANEPLPDGNVLVVYITEATTTTGQVVESPRTGGALIKAMRLPAPDILLRNVSEESTVGIVNAGGETRPFFVFGVTSYERTFAGMLAWERSMTRDLVTLYPARGGGDLAPTGTSTTIGTSTPVFTEPVRPQTAFVDAIVSNHDVRILRDTAGQSLMLYGYVGKDLLILARDEAAYAALLGRLSGKD